MERTTIKQAGLLLIAVATTICGFAVSYDRKATYYPEGNAFVCVNGNNLYSRALYGSNDSEWRIETSDRPIFATYKKNECRNIRFRLRTAGSDIALDSAEWCKARYEGGRRDYLLRDKRWGGGTVTVSVVAYPDCEGGAWKISTEGMGDAAIVCQVSNVAGKRFRRNGDIGTSDNPTVSFGPAPGEEPLQTVSATAEATGGDKTSTIYFSIDVTTVTTGNATAQRFAAADDYRRRLAGSVTFATPDAFINPLGADLVMAADGTWGGQVWMHGAVGWRVPLPGWRGAYAGDFLGMPDRQRRHFDAYSKSMVTDVPVTKPHLMDSANNLARGAYEWGTPMYSNGYICRAPGNNHQFNHYDMNLVFIDELLWHFQFDADTAYMRSMWGLLKSHLEWEKRTWDPDDDGLYDAYCCIWASDALQYNSGAVTHSSAYNYRANKLAARIAGIIGEDPKPYRDEAERILSAMNARLWLTDARHWAEYQDYMGNKRVHPDAAVWSIYTPIDCGACTPRQAYEATQYVDRRIPHIRFSSEGKAYETIATSDWAPYDWSINNVAMAEVLHTALAYWQAGRPDEAFRLLKGTVVDFMYCGSSPGNFGQISYFDVNVGEEYRDFADVTGIASRALVEGLFGITPDALWQRCVIRPGFPDSWDSASVHTPYLDYSFRRVNGRETFTIKQHFARPLQIVIRRNIGGGEFVDTVLTADTVQTVTLDAFPQSMFRTVDMSKAFNANVTDIFANRYLSPRSPYTTLALPVQGIGDWCSTKRTADIDDSGLRSMVTKGQFVAAGIPFRSPARGRNIAFASLWDNYPDSITIPLSGRGKTVCLLMAGSTNPMQSHFENGVVRVEYADGSFETLSLENPSNWCPIEQDYDDGSPAFTLPQPRPYRVSLKTGIVSRTLAAAMGAHRAKGISDEPQNKKAALAIDGGAAEILTVGIDPTKKLKSLTVTATANDVVIGLMAVTVRAE